ncbi:MAG: TolB family protein [Anaerolineales bacterium]
MVRADGSESSLRIPGEVTVPGRLSRALSPVDGLFAYLSTSYPPPGDESSPTLTLNVVSLLGRGSDFSTPLASSAIESDDVFPSEIERAMTESESLAWSPEGRRLAFIGAQDGPSADLYEYYRDSDKVVRLTDGPSQAYSPLWSPDGRWIVHSAAKSFGTGAGFSVAGIYAARADGSGAFSLYDTSADSASDEAIGWLDDHTVVTVSYFPSNGSSDLRLVDLSVQKADLVIRSPLGAVAVGGGSVLFEKWPNRDDSDEDPIEGTFILTASDRTPRLIGDYGIYITGWEEGIGAFLAQTVDSKILEISPAGEIRILPVDGSHLPVVSPGGRYWAYTEWFGKNSEEGVFVAEYGKEPARIFEGGISSTDMLFSTTGDALYFLTETGKLYGAQAPEWTPYLLASGFMRRQFGIPIAWMEGE